MGVWDRDYSKAGRRPGRGGIDWRFRLPPGGTLTLIVVHLLAFCTMVVLRRGAHPEVLTLFVLEGAASHPAAILLHPISTGSLPTLAFVVCVIWALGGRIEPRFGTARLLLLYVLGTLIAGAVYFGFAQMVPELAGYPLAMPAGALAAWALTAWRNLSDEMASIFGQLVTVAKAAAIGAAVVATWIFFWNGPAATGWLIAAAAGSLAYPVLSMARRSVRAPIGPRPLQEARPVQPPSRRDEARPAADAPAIDDLLAKISREGFDALTPAERQRLEAARQAKLRRSR